MCLCSCNLEARTLRERLQARRREFGNKKEEAQTTMIIRFFTALILGSSWIARGWSVRGKLAVVGASSPLAAALVTAQSSMGTSAGSTSACRHALYSMFHRMVHVFYVYGKTVSICHVA